jgi:dTDP-4-dehydrorhamnose reductase
MSVSPGATASSRVLLLGAHGQLGTALCEALPALGRVKALSRAELDFADAAHFAARLQAQLDDFAPDVIVNAAAYTAVDKAQEETALAWQINAHAVGQLAQAAQVRNIVLVHYSTDYVFDGSGERPWVETDRPQPLSVYGQSKRAGEQAIAEAGGRALVLRTSWVVGAHGGNFLKTMLRLGAERDTLRVVADQVGVPTSTRWLAQITCELLRQMHGATARDPRWGVYHAVPSGETSWHGYAVYVLTEAKRRGFALRVNPQNIEPIRTKDYPLPAPRPRNSRLDTRKLRTTFGCAMPPWQAGVDAVIDEILRGQTP